MKLLSDLRSLLASVFHRDVVESDMEEELRSHIQHRADDLESSGLPRAEAERRASIEFGAYERRKEEVREGLGLHLLESVAQDLRFGVRMLRKSPGFTAVAVLTLALGIGANTAVFSLINTVILRFLPVQKPEELVQVLRISPRGNKSSGFTNALWEQLRDRQDVFSSVFSWSNTQFDLAQGGAVNYANGLFTSGNYFSTLGVRPALGRLFSSADDRRGCPSLAVVSYGFWQEHFAGAPTAIGASLSLNNHPFQVIGVSSAGFFGMEVGNRFDVAVPVCAAAVFDPPKSRLDTRDWWWLRIAGRAKPGISLEQVGSRLKALSPVVWGNAVPENWPRESQQQFRQRIFVAAPAAGGLSELREQFQWPLTVLMAIVGLVLLIASANLASLMLARAASRSKEIAVRKALGASRGRLVRQLLTECLLVSTAGALLGVFLAQWGAAFMVRFISSNQNTVFLDLSPDLRVLGFTASIALLTAFLFGLLPALRSTRVSLSAAMKGGLAEHAAQRPHSRLGSGRWIVASQIAFSLVLLVVSGLFLHSLVKLVTLDLGFDRSNVLVVNANVTAANIQPAERPAVYDEIESRLHALPGVVSVGRSSRVPITPYEWSQGVEVDTPNVPKGDDTEVFLSFVSPGYFETMRMPILAGRNVVPGDTRTSVPVAVINESFARTFFPNLDPVGRYFRRVEGIAGKPPTPFQIVGVVKDSKYESVRERTGPQAFFPAAQVHRDDESEFFELRTAARPSALVPSVQNAIAQVNKSVTLDFSSLAEQVDDSLIQERLLATLSTFFGALALLLAMIGLYGAISYAVGQRRNEFGVRIALGAAPASILRLVMRDVAAILLGGSLAGIIISLAAVRFVQKLLFGLLPYDPVTILGAIAVLAAVALVAGYIPARRAMRVDPMVALRYE
jgi:putative ABC transport system permease protein